MISRIVVVASAVFAMSAWAIPSPRDIPAGCDRPYTVQVGDSCNSISATRNASTYQLALVNVNTINVVCDNLVAGMQICLGLAGQDCITTHVMIAGETCAEIAANAGTTLDVFMANNPNVYSGCTNIYPGEVFCTAKYKVYSS